MTTGVSIARRTFAALILGLSVGACAAHGDVYRPPIPQPGLVQVDVFDRTGGATLGVHPKDGRRYIEGTPGHEYAVRIRNTTGARVLVVTSVDGVNVISGDTAAPSQSGYVLEPWGSVEIAGWRKSLERTAAFFFTEHENSYAARTGRPNNVGVIGVAVFREKPRPIARRDLEMRQAPMAAEAPAPSQPASRAADSADELARHESSGAAAKPSSRLGTGHGRDEASRVTVVRFERAGDAPSETVTLRYDRRDNLVAMGVLPPGAPRYSAGEPNPFPGMRFAPDPPR
jgi:hypothetical protein